MSVTDAQNTPPTIDNLPVSKDVKENLAAGTSVFQPEITDPDTADTHTYRVSLYSPNNGEDYFAINTDSKLKKNPFSVKFWTSIVPPGVLLAGR